MYEFMMMSRNMAKESYELPSNDFSLFIEKKKIEMKFDTYLETIVWYIENETDIDYERVAKNLNKKILDCLKYEAMNANLLREKEEWITL